MELKALLNDVQALLNVITTSDKRSIGSINNIYFCLLDSKWCDNLSVEVRHHLTSAIYSEGNDRCTTCGGKKNENPWCSNSFHL